MKSRKSRTSLGLLGFVALFYLFSCHSETKRIPGFEVHGLDVSHHQGRLDWDTIKNERFNFVLVKATEGENYKDSLFQYNWQSLDRIGVVKGAYHFYRPEVQPEKQFENYKNTVQLYPGDLPPVLDVEVGGTLDPEALENSIRSWLVLAEDHYKIRPIIYTYQKFYNHYLASVFPGYPLWIARYHTIEPELSDSAKWTLWQYGDRGKLPGVKGYIDFNVFNGNIRAFENLLIKNDTTVSAGPSY